jgi:hypothetical protein
LSPVASTATWCLHSPPPPPFNGAASSSCSVTLSSPTLPIADRFLSVPRVVAPSAPPTSTNSEFLVGCGTPTSSSSELGALQSSLLRMAPRLRAHSVPCQPPPERDPRPDGEQFPYLPRSVGNLCPNHVRLPLRATVLGCHGWST